MRIVLTRKIRRIIFISAVIIILGLTSMVKAEEIDRLFGTKYSGGDGLYETNLENTPEWTLQSDDLGNYVSKILYSSTQDRTIATKYSGSNNIWNLYNTSNNENWTLNSVMFASAVKFIAYGNGIFLISGNDGYLGYMEEDSEEITYITTNTSNAIDEIFFNNDKFLVRYNNKVYLLQDDFTLKPILSNYNIYISIISIDDNYLIPTSTDKWFKLNTKTEEITEITNQITLNGFYNGLGGCYTVNDSNILCYDANYNWYSFDINTNTFTLLANPNLLRVSQWTNNGTGKSITDDGESVILYGYYYNSQSTKRLMKWNITDGFTELMTSSRILNTIGFTKETPSEIPTYDYEVEYNTNGSANLVFTFTNYINNPQYTFYIGNLSTQYLFEAIPKTENSYRIDNIYGNSVYRFVLYDDITDIMISDEMIDIATELKKVSTPYVKILDYSTNTTFNWNWFNLDDYQQALDNEFNGGENDYPKAYCYYKEYKNGSVYQSPINNCVSISGNGYYTTEFIGDNGYLEVVFSYKKDAESLNYEELYRQQFNFTGDKTLPYIEITSLNNGKNGLVVNINVFNVVATDKIQYSKDNGATWNTLGYGDAEYSLNFMYNINIIVRIVDVDDVELVRASYDVIVDYETYTNGSIQATNLNTILETLRSIFGMENTTNTAMGNLWNKVSNSYVFMFLFTSFIGTVIIYIVVILRRS